MAYFERYSHIALLFAKALQEDLTEEEVRELEAWRLEDKANEALYQSMMSPDFVNGKAAVHEHFQAEPAYQRVRAGIGSGALCLDEGTSVGQNASCS